MKKRKAKKLELHTETLRNLEREDLQDVLGGTVQTDTCPVSVCLSCRPQRPISLCPCG